MLSRLGFERYSPSGPYAGRFGDEASVRGAASRCHQPCCTSRICWSMKADAPPGTSSSTQMSACVFSIERTRVWLTSNGLSVCTSMTSHETPSSSSVCAASRAIAAHAPLQAVAVQDLDDDPRVVAPEERVVEPGRLGHVARHRDVDAPQRVQQHRHRRARVPDADEPVTLGPDHERRLLTTDGAPVQRRQVIRRDLQCIEEVVEVLDVADRPQPAHRRADRLAEDRRLADARVGQTQVAVLRLQALEDEVDVAKLAHVLADDEDPWVAGEVRVEVADKDLPSVYGRRPA